MKQIQPSYATFEQAKKLKEKGFTKENGYACREGWINYLYSFTGATGTPENDSGYVLDTLGNSHLIERPEQWQVVEWLRVNHGIHLEVSCDVYGELWFANLKVCSKEVWEDEDKRHNIITAHQKFDNQHKSKQEVYSAAFDYVLNNLI